jgi:enoyl-CoA hydratase/carnithine racemase
MTIRTDVDTERSVGTVTIDRPEKRNALSPAMLEGVRDAVETLPDADVRVIVVEGTDGIFSAGADIDEFVSRVDDPQRAAVYVEEIHDTYEVVEECPLPVVAKLSGPVVGAGCEIALSSDLRIASEDVTLALSEIDIGLVPPFERASQYLGKARVRELCFTGEPLTTDEPAASQVFNRIVPREDLDAATATLVDTLAEKSPQALSATKQALRHGESVSKRESIAYRKRLEYECFDHPHFEESLSAFLEDRPPSYHPDGD